MLLATLPPVEIVMLDLRPAAEAAALAPVSDAADFVKSTADKLVPSIESDRCKVGVQLHTLVALVLGAEQQGLRLDLSGLVRHLDDQKKASRSSGNRLIEKLKSIQILAQRAKVRGSSSIGNDVIRLNRTLTDWANDLEDHHASFLEIQKRMDKLPATIEARDAAKLYMQAVKKIWHADAALEIETDFMKGGPFIRLTVPVDEDVLADVDDLLSHEDQVHDFVRDQWEDAVGTVAFTYIAAEKVQLTTV